MEGFFSDSDVAVTGDLGGVEKCGACKLNKQCTSPKMQPQGLGKRGILIITDYPTDDEDFEGRMYAGREGRYLRDTFAELGVDVDKDCRRINAVSCYPGDVDEIKDNTMSYCRPLLMDEIEAFKPRVVIILGNAALCAYLQGRWAKKPGGVTRWRGFQIPDWEKGAWVVVSFSPSQVWNSMQTGRGKKKKRTSSSVTKVVFEQDMAKAIECCDRKKPPTRDDRSSVEVLVNEDEALDWLASLEKEIENHDEDEDILVTVDFETTGLKPHRKGHRVVSCSFTTDFMGTGAFLITPKTKKLVQRILRAPNVLKRAANMKFEESWAEECLDTKVEPWDLDTVLAAHVLDNREGVTGTKFQAAVRLGVFDYDSEIKPLLKATDEEEDEHGANGFNQISKIPVSSLLYYNGLDTLYEHEIGDIQEEELERRKLWKAYQLLHDGTFALHTCHENGMGYDAAKAKKYKAEIDKSVELLKKRIFKAKEIKAWKKKYGRAFKLSNNNQLADILFNKFKYEPVVLTDKGNPAVSEAALDALGVSFSSDIIEMRRLEKAKGTYLKNYEREAVDDVIRAVFNLHLAITYRSSSDSPNFQNNPIRQKRIKQMTRGVLVPVNPDWQLIELDLKGAEVSIAACYHKDPVMMTYLNDPTKDMHRDMAAQCYLCASDQVSDGMRYNAKNKFVFPQFYGDYYANCAKALWDAISQMKLTLKDGTPLMQHLRSNGIKNYNDFEQHIKEVENDFWNRRFKVYSAWKETWWESYQSRGWFRTKTGFICSGVMSKNDAINYPVQGSAFHCLLWALVQLCNWSEKEAYEYCLAIGQVHDSAVLEVRPDMRTEVLLKAQDVFSRDLRKAFQWIIAPITIEAEVAPPGASWDYKEEVELPKRS